MSKKVIFYIPNNIHKCLTSALPPVNWHSKYMLNTNGHLLSHVFMAVGTHIFSYWNALLHNYTNNKHCWSCVSCHTWLCWLLVIITIPVAWKLVQDQAHLPLGVGARPLSWHPECDGVRHWHTHTLLLLLELLGERRFSITFWTVDGTYTRHFKDSYIQVCVWPLPHRHAH